MKKICIVIAYDGTDYHGFQRQPNKRTVQGTLEKLLAIVTNEDICVDGAGRTDAGVHALGQVCHFYTQSTISSKKFCYILNRIGPRDLVVQKSFEIDHEFDARKSACWKTYRYELNTSFIPDIRSHRYQMHFRHPLDVLRMQQAASALVGTHDFSSFSSQKTHVKSKVRTIYSCTIHTNPAHIAIEVTGNGFIYNMVRIIAGTLVNVGRGRISAEDIPRILAAKDRSLAGPTFPPHGLTLVRVAYKPWSVIEGPCDIDIF